MSFEKRVEQYLELSGWKQKDYWGRTYWENSQWKHASSSEALHRQLESDYDREGHVERFAELMERSR